MIPRLALILAFALAAAHALARHQPAPPTPPATPSSASPPPTTEPSAPTAPSQFKLDPQGQWQPGAAPAQGSDEELVLRARRALAEDRPDDAYSIIDPWLEANLRSKSPLVPQAFLIRADATSLGGNEFEALYDYEALIKQFAGSPDYITAIERELEIAVRYLNGLDRKFLGMRIVDASDLGEELLVRVQERLPGSRLAERAGIELADYYYRVRDMKLAAEAYQLFLENFPQSSYRMHAMQRRIYASLARFKGPRYDSAPLLDAAVNIRRFRNLYPAQAQQAGIDDALLTRVDESAAQQILEAANWYLARGDLVSARYQLRQIIRKHPYTAAHAQASRIMTARGWLDPQPSASPASQKESFDNPAPAKPNAK